MEYTILEAVEKNVLIKYVNEDITNGWIPQGGVCESGIKNTSFFQAMVKHK